MHPGPHALLFVIRLGRYTKEDHDVYTRLKALLDERIKDHTIIVFTHGDQLKPTAGQSIHEIIQDGPDNLKNLMAECGNRYVLFDNTEKNKRSQVDELMRMVFKLKKDNEDKPYQCPRYAYVSDKIEEEARKRLAEVEKKELERNEHYQKLEEELQKRDRKLEQIQQELDRRERELNLRETREYLRLMDIIQSLEKQLREAQDNKLHEGKIHTTDHNSDRQNEQHKRVATPVPRMTKILQSMQTGLGSKSTAQQQAHLQPEYTEGKQGNGGVTVEKKENVQVPVSSLESCQSTQTGLQPKDTTVQLAQLKPKDTVNQSGKVDVIAKENTTEQYGHRKIQTQSELNLTAEKTNNKKLETELKKAKQQLQHEKELAELNAKKVAELERERGTVEEDMKEFKRQLQQLQQEMQQRAADERLEARNKTEAEQQPRVNVRVDQTDHAGKSTTCSIL